MVKPTSAIQREIRQTKPFASPEQEGFLALLRTTDLARRRFAEVVEPRGITGQQYNVLRILRGAGADGLCRNEVGERLVRRVPDVTRLLDRMEGQKLVSRQRGSDRRYVTTKITSRGLALLDRLDEDVRESHDRLLGHLGDRRLRTLIELLGDARERT